MDSSSSVILSNGAGMLAGGRPCLETREAAAARARVSRSCVSAKSRIKRSGSHAARVVRRAVRSGKRLAGGPPLLGTAILLTRFPVF